jgi:cytochrome P450
MLHDASSHVSIKNIYSDQYIADPYPLYHQIREQAPVFWDEKIGEWVVTGYNEVVAALRDPRTTVQGGWSTEWLPEQLRNILSPPMQAIARQLLFIDPPDHTRLRGLVSKAFTPRMVEKMRLHIQEIVDALLDAMQGRQEIEVVREFAYPLPSIVIAEMLGVPPEDREQFIQWSDDFSHLLDGTGLTEEQWLHHLYALIAFMDYFRQIIVQRRTQPKDDMMQALIQAQEGGSVLNDDELLGNCMLLLAAGHITTTHLIGNGLLALLQHPEQYARLKSEPALIPGAVLEFLRYDTPVQATGRRAKEAFILGGQQLRAGDAMYICLGAANRDPSQFEEPDRFDILRAENKNVSFGHGVHYCLGSPLAKLEAEIAFSTFLRRVEEPRLDIERVERWTGAVFRGVKTLPLSVTRVLPA